MTNEEAKRIAIGLRTDFKCKSNTMVDFCNTIIKTLGQTSPCDLCQYNPPSSGDGKPCSMCPACSRGNEE